MRYNPTLVFGIWCKYDPYPNYAISRSSGASPLSTPFTRTPSAHAASPNLSNMQGPPEAVISASATWR